MKTDVISKLTRIVFILDWSQNLDQNIRLGEIEGKTHLLSKFRELDIWTQITHYR